MESQASEDLAQHRDPAIAGGPAALAAARAEGWFTVSDTAHPEYLEVLRPGQHRRRQSLAQADNQPRTGQRMARLVTVGAAQLGPIQRSETRAQAVERMLDLMHRAQRLQCDLDLCNSHKETVFNFAAHRRPEHHRLIVERTGALPPDSP